MKKSLKREQFKLLVKEIKSNKFRDLQCKKTFCSALVNQSITYFVEGKDYRVLSVESNEKVLLMENESHCIIRLSDGSIPHTSDIFEYFVVKVQ